jgi:hypothetical protein
MEHIRAIQELVDEHKEAMPTGVVTDVMEHCQKAYEVLPKLWKVTFICVTVDNDNDLCASKKTMIVEEVAVDAPRHWYDVFDTATIPPAEMHDRIGGHFYATEGKGTVRVVVKVEPFLKRVRDGP